MQKFNLGLSMGELRYSNLDISRFDDLKLLLPVLSNCLVGFLVPFTVFHRISFNAVVL